VWPRGQNFGLCLGLKHLASAWRPGLDLVFTRDSIYAIARIMLSPVRLSVYPSVCRSVRRVDHTKTVEDRIMKHAASGSPMILVFWRQILSQHSKGFPRTGASKKGGV